MFSDEPPPLIVPASALEKPEGAEVGEDGNVGCVTCGQRFPPSKMDIVGMGYRCAPCSHQAEIGRLQGGADAAAHLDRGEREGLRAAGAQKVAAGVAMLVGGVVVLAIGLPRTGIALLVGGGAWIGVGVARKDAAG